MAQLRISLLGPFQVSRGGLPISGFESDKARALLAYLVVEADRPHRREALAGLLWPDTPERTARTNLRSALANLRQVIRDHQATPPFFISTRQTIQFNLHSDYELDVKLFLDGLSDVEDSKGAQTNNQIATLKNAINLYRGEFLTGFYLRDAPLFEEWTFVNREALQRQALSGLHLLTSYYQELNNYDQALKHAQHQITLEPYQETAHQQVMWLLALNGQRNEALAHYKRFHNLLQDELSTKPLEQTQAMHARILSNELPELPKTTIILRREPREVGECPYRGLAPFREVDAPFFFGREEFSTQLEEAVQKQSMVAVIVGSSGMGKSSVVYAGLLPRLRDDRSWQLVNLRPSGQPLQALANSLLPASKANLRGGERVREIQNLAVELQEGELSLIDLVNSCLQETTQADRLLLFVDQFEELYTHCP